MAEEPIVADTRQFLAKVPQEKFNFPETSPEKCSASASDSENRSSDEAGVNHI